MNICLFPVKIDFPLWDFESLFFDDLIWFGYRDLAMQRENVRETSMHEETRMDEDGGIRIEKMTKTRYGIRALQSGSICVDL